MRVTTRVSIDDAEFYSCCRPMLCELVSSDLKKKKKD